MRLVAIGLVLSVLVSGCASQLHRATTEDRTAFQQVENKHVECLSQKTAEYVRGSNDAGLLVKHVISLCEPILGELNREILSRGFSPAYARGYITASRKEAEQITLSGILKIKSGDAP